MPDDEPPAALDEVAAAFARACRAAGVDHLFVGGFAVLAWGQPRTTSDIPVLLDYGPQDVPALVEALEEEGLEVAGYDLREGLMEGSHVTVFTADPILTVDVKPALASHERDEIAAGQQIQLDQGTVRVASPEDTVAFKLLYGSPQDLQDARSIVARQGERLDHGRLRAVAERHGVLDQAEALLASVEEDLAEQGREG